MPRQVRGEYDAEMALRVGAFWKENLRRSFVLLGHGEVVIAWLPAIVTALVGAVAGVAAANTITPQLVPASVVGFAVWMFLLLFVWTPMRMWSDQVEQIETLTTRCLRVEPRDKFALGTMLTPEDGTFGIGVLVTAVQPDQPIRDCIGIIEATRAILQDGTRNEDPDWNFPPPGHHLVWQSSREHDRETATLGQDTLVVAFRRPNESFTQIPRPDGDLGRYASDHAVGGGSVPTEMDIRIFSKSVPISSERVRVVIGTDDWHYPKFDSFQHVKR